GSCASARGGCRDSRPTPTATSCSRWTGSSAATVPSSPIPRGTCCGCGGGDPAAQRVVAPAPRVDSPGASAPTTRCGTYGASSAAISSAVSSRSSAPSAPSMCEDTCCSAPSNSPPGKWNSSSKNSAAGVPVSFTCGRSCRRDLLPLTLPLLAFFALLLFPPFLGFPLLAFLP